MNAIQVEMCPACGKPLRPDNGSGVCYLCQQSGRTGAKCKDCGDPISRFSRTGLCAPCFQRTVDVLVAQLSAAKR